MGTGWEDEPMTTVEATIRQLPPKAARMVAVEILLADPEALGDDVLEGCLYVYREKLRAS
ncbi:MAG: hypothetical protein QOG28_2275 [Trebonia sp.]|jgi:hypothetical protein|nr:hypothetical protein [Actinomycetes bacterium]MDX6417655.1 hypothetical protein [Trebonia sp.]